MEVFLMAKNKKLKQRQRTFKVGANVYGIPFIRFGGHYLSRELGLTSGDRLEVTRYRDGVMLRKFSAMELAQYEQGKKQKALLKSLFPRHQKQATALLVAENRYSTYNIDDERINHPEKYLLA